MKKGLLLMAIVSLILVLSACQSEEDKAFERIEAAMASLDLEGLEVDENIDLPSAFEGVEISYSSSDPFHLDRHGFVNRPLNHEQDQSVTLTATFKTGGFEDVKDYELTVKAFEPFSVTETKTVDFVNLANEYLLEDSSLTLYESNRHLQYVELMSFIELLEGAIEGDAMTIEVDGPVVLISVEYEAEESVFDDETYTLLLDFENNEVTVSHFDFFTAFQAETQTEFGAGLDYVDAVVERFDAVTFDLDRYRIELSYHDSMHLIPLNLANLFFSGSMFDVYYNGSLYGVDTYQLLDGSETLQTLRPSHIKVMPYDLKLATYHYLVFTFDYFYGLKEDQGVDSYYQRFDRFRNNILSNNEDHYLALMIAAYSLDDLHTSYLANGMYSEQMSPQLELAHLGSRTRDYLTVNDQLGSYCRNLNDLTYFNDDTYAMINLSAFTEDTPEQMRLAVESIYEQGNVEKVVLNLACNGGGVIGTAWQTMGYLTDDPMLYYSQDMGDLSKTMVAITSENEKLDVDWYVLQSKNTYSAANLFSSMAKDLDIATIIGEQSRGGAASITTNILPSGAIIIMSSNNVLTNQHYESIEFGVTPNIEIPFDSYRNIESIVEYLN